MADPYQKVRRGDRLSLKAGTINAAIDAARAERLTRSDRLVAAGQAGAVQIAIQNKTGAALPSYSVLGLGNPLVGPAANLPEFQAGLALEGSAPPTPVVTGKFAVTQDPLADDAIGRGLVSGPTICRLKVSGTLYECAEAEAGTTRYLLSSATGSARVLWSQDSTEAAAEVDNADPEALHTGERWAMVAMEGGAPGPDIQILRVPYPATVTSGKYTCYIQTTNGSVDPATYTDGVSAWLIDPNGFTLTYIKYVGIKIGSLSGMPVYVVADDRMLSSFGTTTGLGGAAVYTPDLAGPTTSAKHIAFDKVPGFNVTYPTGGVGSVAGPIAFVTQYPASSLYSGYVTTGRQVFAGDKLFAGYTVARSGLIGSVVASGPSVDSCAYISNFSKSEVLGVFSGDSSPIGVIPRTDVRSIDVLGYGYFPIPGTYSPSTHAVMRFATNDLTVPFVYTGTESAAGSLLNYNAYHGGSVSAVPSIGQIAYCSDGSNPYFEFVANATCSNSTVGALRTICTVGNGLLTLYTNVYQVAYPQFATHASGFQIVVGDATGSTTYTGQDSSFLGMTFKGGILTTGSGIVGATLSLL